MNYLVSVWADRIEAETAYSALESAGYPLSQVSILGRGYKTADEFGLIDPNEEARKQIRIMATWLVPFGFVAGITFSVISGLQTFAWAGEIGNHVIGGLLGAIAASMGSVFVGGGAGIAFGGGDALPYRNRLNAGQYLVVIQGNEALTRQALKVLRTLNPQSFKTYQVQEPV
ncbi:MAG: hypothetical protein ACO3NK_12540 [Prochlorotrichaceae cyanobacterium]|jgi:hypothetical protein